MSTLTRIRFVALAAFVVCGPRMLAAQDAAGERFFESKIRPALIKHCYACHSSESGKTRGGLKLETRESMLVGGDTGPAIVPRSLDKSLLFHAVQYGDDAYQMPPKGKLPDAVIADFRTWILMGAPDPRVVTGSAPVESAIDVEEGRNYWAYRSPQPTEAPESRSSSWARTEIDRFVIAKLDEQQLQPVSDAKPAALVRRLYFTLIGLPPSPDAIVDWTQRLDAQADDLGRQSVLAELVDELLRSPRYGERWGRHWMDVARFAESTGGDQNNLYQQAWRYRDYVIDAFNDDKPFDQFIREQIAGDLLPIADDEEWANNVIATGFLALGVKLVGEEDQQKFFADLVDEQIDTTMRAFLATTVACARCHDHKFDPIPQQDYYALAGIFRSTETHYGLLKAQARQATTLLDLTGLGPPPSSKRLDPKQLQTLVQERDDAAQAVTDAMARIRSGENVFRGMLRRLRSQRDETEAALRAYSESGNPRVFAMGTQDRDYPLTTHLLIRGEIDQPAQTVPRGFLQVVSPPSRHALSSRTEGSGRLQLANWIASNKNPLTARVIANRVWHWMFGAGLVRTVDDFGRSGDRPTHPELLDYLALQLIANDWSIKALVKEIACSRTWQLSSSYDEKCFSIDPDNTFRWRMSPRRLDAEAIRDSMLAVSGTLDLQRPLGTYLDTVGEGGVGQNVFEPVIRAIDTKTRSVYLPRVRNVLPEMLDLFDAPDAGLVAGSRQSTSSSLQALFLMNHPFVHERSAALANIVERLPKDEQVEQLYMLLFSRPPSTLERRAAADFLSQPWQDVTTVPGSTAPESVTGGRFGGGRFSRTQRMDRTSSTPVAEASVSRLVAYCHALLCTTEFQIIE